MSDKHRTDFFEKPTDKSTIKLRIVEKYLKPWAAKVGSPGWVHKVWIIDGFAGQGTYDDGSPGSPKLILERARDVALEGRSYSIGPIFVEKARSRARALEALCKDYPVVESRVIHGDFWNQIDQLAPIVRDQPVLVIIDPFGLKGLDYKALAHLASASRKCDLIVTFFENAAPRLEADYHEFVTAAIGPPLRTEASAAETFARNMSDAANFLPAGRFPIRQSFDAAAAYELIVFSRSPHAYRLWNDFMAAEWKSLEHKHLNHPGQLPFFSELSEEAAAVDAMHRAAEAISDWARDRRFTRGEMIDYFVVHRFCKFHTSTLVSAVGFLERCGRLKRHQAGPKPSVKADSWQAVHAGV